MNSSYYGNNVSSLLSYRDTYTTSLVKNVIVLALGLTINYVNGALIHTIRKHQVRILLILSYFVHSVIMCVIILTHLANFQKQTAGTGLCFINLNSIERIPKYQFLCFLLSNIIKTNFILSCITLCTVNSELMAQEKKVYKCLFSSCIMPKDVCLHIRIPSNS